MRTRIGLAIFTTLLVWVPETPAQLNDKDRQVIKEMMAGTLYLRNNVPCRFTSGGFGGVGAEVVTEVSPTGVDWDTNLKAIEEQNKKKKRRGGIDTIFWGFGPNDVVQHGKLYFKKGEVIEYWGEGEKDKNVEMWIRFIDIRSLDDFRKAYALIVSPKPIHDEHPEWPEDVRSAIAGRKLVEGMTKEQAFAVVGTPIGVETGDDGGKKVETWFPRQDTGASGSWGKVLSSTTGFPTSLRFVDGRLAKIGQGSGPVKVKLEN